jgi:hypothetical protein
MGEGGAEKWCFDEVSSIDAVAMGGRDSECRGMRNERFFKLRARRPGDSGRAGLGAGNNLELSEVMVDSGAASTGRKGAVNLG